MTGVQTCALPISFLRDLKTLLWWLSVDNTFSALARTNLNHLRSPRVIHACQSAYARDVAAALGLNPCMLSDYTVTPDIAREPLTLRAKKLCLNGGGKVIFDLGAIAARIRDAAPEADIVLIADMPRDEVYGHFASSRLFVDLGSFPGKDRMAREALSLGVNAVIAAAGAGRHAEDYRFPDDYRWRMADIDELVALAVDMLRRPEDHSRKFDPARVAIRNEKAVFEVETRAAFGLSGGET